MGTEILNITGMNLGRLVCIRQLFASLSLLRAGFDPGSWHVRFAVNKATGFSPITSVFPCQYHSTTAPISPSSTCCSYLKDILEKPGNLKKVLLFRKTERTIISFFKFLMNLKNTGCWWGNPRGRDRWGDQGVDGRILGWTFRRWDRV